jgi:hypothetical protein
MDRYLKVAAGAGVFALVLSAIAGALAGVVLGTILVRAVVAGIVFGLGALGIRILAERLLPELVEGTTDSSPGSARAASGETANGGSPGGRLNIVVEETDANGSSYDDEDDDDPDHGEDLVEEIEERSVDDEHEAHNSVIEEESGGHGESLETDSDDEEEMPDIGGFSGSFVSSEGGESDDEYDEESGFGEDGTGSGKSRSNGNDPETIAKALRTMMGRDS